MSIWFIGEKQTNELLFHSIPVVKMQLPWHFPVQGFWIGEAIREHSESPIFF